MKTTSYSWLSLNVADRNLDVNLNEIESKGYEILMLIPREFDESIGAATVTIVARKLEECSDE